MIMDFLTKVKTVMIAAFDWFPVVSLAIRTVTTVISCFTRKSLTLTLWENYRGDVFVTRREGMSWPHTDRYGQSVGLACERMIEIVKHSFLGNFKIITVKNELRSNEDKNITLITVFYRVLCSSDTETYWSYGYNIEGLKDCSGEVSKGRSAERAKNNIVSTWASSEGENFAIRLALGETLVFKWGCDKRYDNDEKILRALPFSEDKRGG